MNQVAFNLFNAGLFLAGFLGLPFAVALWNEAQKRVERVGVGMLVVTLFGNMGVGVAYVDGPYEAAHFPAAITFFLGIALTIWIYSTGQVQRSNAERGLGPLWVTNGYVIMWIVWIILEAMVYTGDGDTWTWFAVPEFLGAVVFGTWIAGQARRLLSSETAI